MPIAVSGKVSGVLDGFLQNLTDLLGSQRRLSGIGRPTRGPDPVSTIQQDSLVAFAPGRELLEITDFRAFGDQLVVIVESKDKLDLVADQPELFGCQLRTPVRQRFQPRDNASRRANASVDDGFGAAPASFCFECLPRCGRQFERDFPAPVPFRATRCLNCLQFKIEDLAVSGPISGIGIECSGEEIHHFGWWVGIDERLGDVVVVLKLLLCDALQQRGR